MNIGRNDPCSCGSGKKYKKCCMNKGGSPKTEERNKFINSLSIKDRNIILFNEICKIFGFNKGKDWWDLKKDISGSQIKELYKIIKILWPPDTNLSTYLPKPDNKLRALYIGMHRPELIIRNIVRYTLYTDEIIAISPFLNPWCIASTYNPILNPDQYKEDTLKNISFLLQLMPWIENGTVCLIPDPGDFDYDLRIKTWELAKDRYEKNKIKIKISDEMQDLLYKDIKRDFYRLPQDVITETIKSWDPQITQNDLEGMLKYISEIKQKDPYVLNQETDPRDAQMIITTTGLNFEMGLYVAQLTGSYLYTDLEMRWQEILSCRQQSNSIKEIWSPLTKAFQKLDFKFLENIDSKTACSIRKDGRLENFRIFLRKVWSSIGGSYDLDKADQLARDFSDELKTEYNKAKIEWSEIDKKLLKWVTGTGGASTLLTARMSVEIPALGFCIASIGNLLASRMDRSRFRQNIPMSVFIDLQRKKPWWRK